MATRPILETPTQSTSIPTHTNTQYTTQVSLPTTHANTSPSLNSRVTPSSTEATPLTSTTNTLFKTLETTSEAALEKAWSIITQAQTTHYLSTSYREALAIANHALEQHPKSSDLWVLQATCYFNLAKYAEASAAAIKALEHDPNNGAAMSVLIDCEEQPKAASPVSHLQSAIFSPLDEETFRATLDTFLQFEKPAQAQAEIERLEQKADAVLEQNPTNTKAFCTQLFAKILQGKILDVDMTSFFETPKLVEQCTELFNKTLPVVEDILRKNPQHIGALALKVSAIFFTAQKENASAVVLSLMHARHDRHAIIGPEEVLASITGTQNIGQGALYIEPLAAAQVLLKQDPKNRVALSISIGSLRMLGRVDEAIELGHTALAYYPNDGILLTLQSLCLTSKNPLLALKAADDALAISKETNVLAWFAKLAALFQQKEIEAVLAAALEAKELFPANPIFHKIVDYYVK